MARARNIKPGFFKNEGLVDLDPLDRLLFIGMWCLADREGRIENRPKRIKMELFPCDNYDVAEGIKSLEASGFVRCYEAEGFSVIEVCNFAKHQAPHGTEKDSELPDCNGYLTVHERSKNGCVTGGKRLVKCGATLNNVNPPLDNALIPDSLIPDSLIPEYTPSSLRDVPPSDSAKQKSVTLSQWIVGVHERGEKLMSDYEPLTTYTEKVGLPADWVELAWIQFKDRYTTDEKAKRKRYTNWRLVFKRAVEENWMKLWFYSDADKQFRLTTVGVSADLATREAA